MKKTKTLSKTLAVISFVIYVVFLIIDLITGDGTGLALGTSSIAFVLALGFIFAKNQVVEKIGNALLLLVGLFLLAYGISSEDTLGLIFGIIVLALNLVAVMTFFVRSILLYFGYAKTDIELRENLLAQSLKQIKGLADKEVLSNEEYAKLKALFLNKDLTASEKAALHQRVLFLEKGLINFSDIAE